MARRTKSESLADEIVKLRREILELENEKTKKLERLIESQVKLKIDLENEKRKIKAEIGQISREERAARTHALCVIGGLWEKYVGDLDFEFCGWLLSSIDRAILDNERRKYERERNEQKPASSKPNPAPAGNSA